MFWAQTLRCTICNILYLFGPLRKYFWNFVVFIDSSGEVFCFVSIQICIAIGSYVVASSVSTWRSFFSIFFLVRLFPGNWVGLEGCGQNVQGIFYAGVVHASIWGCFLVLWGISGVPSFAWVLGVLSCKSICCSLYSGVQATVGCML